MTKQETKRRLDAIRQMSDEEIAGNAEFIRETADSALQLIIIWESITRKYVKPTRRCGVFNKITEDK